VLFQIKSYKACLAIDLSKVDFIQIEDSDELGDDNRYAICFYQFGIEDCASFNIGKLSIDDRIKLFETICAAKASGEPPLEYVIR